MSQPNSSKSSLLSDVQIVGTITFKGELVFDGKFEGQSIQGSTLSIGSRGTVHGDIHADYVTIDGAVEGDVTITEKCHLTATARLQGDLKTSRLVMDDGATFIGTSEIKPKPGNIVNIDSARKAG